MLLIVVKISLSDFESLPFTWVCQTASPTPHKLETIKNTKGWSGLGAQISLAMTREKWTMNPKVMSGNLPVYFIKVPKSTEQIAFITPKQIITYPT